MKVEERREEMKRSRTRPEDRAKRNGCLKGRGTAKSRGKTKQWLTNLNKDLVHLHHRQYFAQAQPAAEPKVQVDHFHSPCFGGTIALYESFGPEHIDVLSKHFLVLHQTSVIHVDFCTLRDMFSTNGVSASRDCLGKSKGERGRHSHAFNEDGLRVGMAISNSCIGHTDRLVAN